MKYRGFILCFLLMLLTSSSFSFINYFEKSLNKSALTPAQINFGLTHEITLVQRYQLEHLPKYSQQWLQLANKLAPKNNQLWLSIAQHFFQQEDVELAQQYWLKAHHIGINEASLALANLAYQREQYSTALQFISSISDQPFINTTQYILLKAKLLLDTGQVVLLDKLAKAQRSNHQVRYFFDELAQYRVFEKGELSSLLNNKTRECSASITLFATRYRDLQRWQSLITQFEQHPLSQFMCIDGIAYRAISHLKCEHEPEQAIDCKEEGWLDYAHTVTSRFIGLMLPKGKANVHYGILYIDSRDSWQVFAHEIAHLFGFIDEYQLSNNHNVCKSAGVKGHNLFVLSSEEANNSNPKQGSLFEGVNIPWRNYINDINKSNKESIGIYAADTCKGSSFNAYKPLKKFTALRSNNEAFPTLYVSLLKQNPEQFMMPSFHYNIAYALYLNGKNGIAKNLLDISANFVNDKTIKLKIKQGAY